MQAPGARGTCPVFPDKDGGPRRKSNLIRRSYKPLLRAAGLPDVSFHSLRHVANSVLLAAGESPKVAAERLGHSTTRMTMDIYAHVLPTTQRSAVTRLDKAFRDIGCQVKTHFRPPDGELARQRKSPPDQRSTGFPAWWR